MSDPLPSTPQRLSPLTPVVRGPILLLAALGASWQQLLHDGDRTVTGAILAAVLLGGLVFGLLSWIRTTFWVAEDELRIDTGVIARQSRRIRIDRLQGIDVAQPALARVFGLAELRFDLAGGDREASLAFLPLSDADRLRTQLLSRRDARRAGHEPGAAPAGTATPAPTSPAVPERVLSRLQPGLLVASLLLSGESLGAGLTAVVLLTAVVGTGATWASFGVGLPAVLGFGAALVNRLVGYYGFTVGHSDAGLHIRRGLLTLSSQTIALHRVQGVVVTEPLLWRPFGWAKVEVALAGYRHSDSDRAAASSTLLPVAPRDEALALARFVLGGLDPAAVRLHRPPRRARWLAPLSWPFLGTGLDDRLLVSRRGVFQRRLDAVPHQRVQSLRLHQGPLQRLLRVVDVHADSPPGPVAWQGSLRDPAEARLMMGDAIVRGRRARAATLASADPAPPAAPPVLE